MLHPGWKGGGRTSGDGSQRLAEGSACTGPSAELGVFHLAASCTDSNYCRRVLDGWGETGGKQSERQRACERAEEAMAGREKVSFCLSLPAPVLTRRNGALPKG